MTNHMITISLLWHLPDLIFFLVVLNEIRKINKRNGI